MVDLLSIGSVAVPTALFTAGVAWGAVKQSLNGTKGAVREIRELVQKQTTDHAHVQQRVASLEAKTDIILDSILGRSPTRGN